MMTNLFSIFDPSSSLLKIPMNWVSTPLGLIFIPALLWLSSSRLHMILMSLIISLSKEMNMLLTTKNKALLVIPLSIFLMILLNNILGLLPFIFTATSHLMLSLSLALPLWLGYFLFSWISNTYHTLAHLVPQGTPPGLMPFMVLVESLSNTIRPFTLAIRLSANMIAGHLLLTLMSNTISILNPLVGITIMLTQTLLMTLEIAVAAIQAYVFMTLCTLYIKEV